MEEMLLLVALDCEETAMSMRSKEPLLIELSWCSTKPEAC